MYLLREDIAGFTDEATNGAPIYKLSTSIEAGFIDITSIENLHSFAYKVAGIDYKFYRDEIKSLIDQSGGFTAQNDTIKNICCIHKIGTHAEMQAFLGTQQAVIDLMRVYSANTSICRDMRFFEIEIMLRNELPDNHKDALDEARTQILDYIFFAVEGTDSGDLEGLLDYLIGKVGTSFDGIGLINKAWAPVTMNITDLSNKCYNILANGDYYFNMPPNKEFIIL
jgi:hypothetical protein